MTRRYGPRLPAEREGPVTPEPYDVWYRTGGPPEDAPARHRNCRLEEHKDGEWTLLRRCPSERTATWDMEERAYRWRESSYRVTDAETGEVLATAGPEIEEDESERRDDAA